MRVREKGLEPSRLAAQEPKSCVYTNFTTPAGSDPLYAEGGQSLSTSAERAGTIGTEIAGKAATTTNANG